MEHGALLRTAALAALPVAFVALGGDGYACDGQTDQWVRGVANYWHGALGRADFCNNAAIGADRQKAADCAWIATSNAFSAPPDPGCARAAIENSPQGRADLDEFVRQWAVLSGADCSQASIDRFAPYWHGALGKAEYCNNATIGAHRERAKDCAFQALVRDQRVPTTSCLRDAIADSAAGKADLDEFVRKWTAELEQVPLANFNTPPQIFSCSVVDLPKQWKCVPTSGLEPPFQKEYCDWFDQPSQTTCTWQAQGLSGGNVIELSGECCASPGTVGIILQVSDRLKGRMALRVGSDQISVQGRGESFPFTPELRAGPLTVNLAGPLDDWLIFTTSRDVYCVDVAQLATYSGRNVVFRWVEDCCVNRHIQPDPHYATESGAPADRTLLEEPSGALWVVFDATRYRVPDRDTLNRVYSNRLIYRVPDGEPARRLRGVPRDGTLLREESGTIWIVYGGAKFHVPDPSTLDRLFAGWPIYPLWDNALDSTPDAPADGTLLRKEDGRVWVVFGRAKFHVPDPATLNRLYSGRPVLQVWDGALDALGSIPVDGTFLREESDPRPYQMVNGHKVRPIGIDADAVRVLWDGALAGIP